MFYKITTADETFSDSVFQDGLNVTKEKWTDDSVYEKDVNLIEFVSGSNIFLHCRNAFYIREVTLPVDAELRHSEHFWYADKVILGPRRYFWTWKTFALLYEKGTNMEIGLFSALNEACDRKFYGAIRFMLKKDLVFFEDIRETSLWKRAISGSIEDKRFLRKNIRYPLVRKDRFDNKKREATPIYVDEKRGAQHIVSFKKYCPAPEENEKPGKFSAKDEIALIGLPAYMEKCENKIREKLLKIDDIKVNGCCEDYCGPLNTFDICQIQLYADTVEKLHFSSLAEFFYNYYRAYKNRESFAVTAGRINKRDGMHDYLGLHYLGHSQTCGVYESFIKKDYIIENMGSASELLIKPDELDYVPLVTRFGFGLNRRQYLYSADYFLFKEKGEDSVYFYDVINFKREYLGELRVENFTDIIARYCMLYLCSIYSVNPNKVILSKARENYALYCFGELKVRCIMQRSPRNQIKGFIEKY